MDWEEVNSYLISKAVVVALISIFCKLPFWAILLMAVGIILVCVAAVALGDLERKAKLRETFYYLGLILQVVPLLILTIGYLQIPYDEDIGWFKAIALGFLCVSLTVSWFADAFDGKFGYLSSYVAAGTILIVELIIWAICGISPDKQYHTLIIINLVASAICVIVVIIARLKLGSNME